jgi:hypothetical protein
VTRLLSTLAEHLMVTISVALIPFVLIAQHMDSVFLILKQSGITSQDITKPKKVINLVEILAKMRQYTLWATWNIDSKQLNLVLVPHALTGVVS